MEIEKKKRKEKPKVIANRIAILPYSTFERVPVIFYHTNLLRSMPLGNNEDLDRGYDDMIGCATCSLSQHLMQ